MTNETHITSEGDGENTEESAGTVTDTVTQKQERVFTQTELDDHIKARLAEDRKRRDKEFEKRLQEALATNESDIEHRVAELMQQKELELARVAIAKEFELSELQASRLAGLSAEEIRADAEALFGKRLPKAPTLVPGSSKARAEDDEIAAALKDAIRRR